MNKFAKIRGFTLIEVLIVLAILGILSAIAFPSYTGYTKKQKTRAAQVDLIALALNMENYYQQQLSYPAATTTTSETKTALPGWSPSQGGDFRFIIQSVSGTTYTLQAIGTSTVMADCTVALSEDNTRTLTTGCGGTTSWY